MGYLTTNKLSNLVDVPVAMAATEVQQGDWVVVASIKVVSPMKIVYKFLNLSLVSSTVDIAQISNTNKIASSLGLAYVVLRRDYVSGSPGAAGALDSLVITAQTTVARDTDLVLSFTTPGVYSWIVANNMQPSSSSSIPTSTDINFQLSVSGQVRVELDSNA